MVTLAIEHSPESALSWQPPIPQNCPALHAVPHAPQCWLSVVASTQCVEQQVRPVEQPMLVPSWSAVHATAHWLAPHTWGVLHSVSAMQLWQSWLAVHTPLAQLAAFLQPEAQVFCAVQYCPSGQRSLLATQSTHSPVVGKHAPLGHAAHGSAAPASPPAPLEPAAPAESVPPSPEPASPAAAFPAWPDLPAVPACEVLPPLPALSLSPLLPPLPAGVLWSSDFELLEHDASSISPATRNVAPITRTLIAIKLSPRPMLAPIMRS